MSLVLRLSFLKNLDGGPQLYLMGNKDDGRMGNEGEVYYLERGASQYLSKVIYNREY